VLFSRASKRPNPRTQQVAAAADRTRRSALQQRGPSLLKEAKPEDCEGDVESHSGPRVSVTMEPINSRSFCGKSLARSGCYLPIDADKISSHGRGGGHNSRRLIF